jgi:hypothetical protein
VHRFAPNTNIRSGIKNGGRSLDGYLDLIHDPSKAGFKLEDGWLVATDVPGLGYIDVLG